ncbi:hypothetical protein Taro_020566 [Colocasia esculenta]|uniref:Uncharacterized protein n=1 Tax=Colocasia esculenta TaxID=4460 RepID=A0A843UZ33_COLES|nr:hypothetical protein [Colocasia esculenta]
MLTYVLIANEGSRPDPLKVPGMGLRRCSPQGSLSEPLKVSGLGLRRCSPQVWWFVVSTFLDLLRWSGSWAFRPWLRG